MSVRMRLGAILAASAAGLCMMAALSGCGREADRASRPEATTASVSSADDRAVRSSSRSERASEIRRSRGGAQLFWASSRQRTAEESAQRQFDRNGPDFQAGSLDDYVAKARAFVSDPPKGSLSTTRTNGDVLYYDPKSNVFAVADKDGVPRTMFKPRDGKAYWAQQTQSTADGRPARRNSRRRNSDSGSADG